MKTVAESSNQQTVLLSATLSPGVERLAGLSLRDPVHVEVTDVPGESVGTELESHVLPEGLDHNYIITPAKLRLVTLAAFIIDKCLVSLAGSLSTRGDFFLPHPYSPKAAK